MSKARSSLDSGRILPHDHQTKKETRSIRQQTGDESWLDRKSQCLSAQMPKAPCFGVRMFLKVAIDVDALACARTRFFNAIDAVGRGEIFERKIRDLPTHASV
jgi:hypothetical protein